MNDVVPLFLVFNLCKSCQAGMRQRDPILVTTFLFAGFLSISENGCLVCTTFPRPRVLGIAQPCLLPCFLTKPLLSLSDFLVFYFMSTDLGFGSIDLDVARCWWRLISHVRVLRWCWTCSLSFPTTSLPRRFFCFWPSHAVLGLVFSEQSLPHRFSPTHVLIEVLSLFLGEAGLLRWNSTF